MINYLQISRKWKSIEIMLFLFSSTSAFAIPGHGYLGLTGGVTRGSLGNSDPQIVYYNNQINDSYPLHNQNTNTSIAGVNFGYEFPMNEDNEVEFAFGLGGYMTPNHYSYDGQLIETINGSSSTTLYNYKFNVTSNRLMAEAKVFWNLDHFSPFIDIGIGAAWNRFASYNETPAANGIFVALPPFQANTTSSFAYQVGLGVSYTFNFVENVENINHERVSLGYRYVNMGNVSSGTRGDAYPYSISLGKLTSNEVYLNFTYLF